MVNPARIECTRAADDAMHFVSLVEQELRQVGSILSGDACDYGFFHVLSSIVILKKEYTIALVVPCLVRNNHS